MTQPIWLSQELALALHDRLLLSEFGGPPGLRDRGLLDSALARPKQLRASANPGIAGLADAYTAGILRNHPFVDGNKRVGFLLAFVFLARKATTSARRRRRPRKRCLILRQGHCRRRPLRAGSTTISNRCLHNGC